MSQHFFNQLGLTDVEVDSQIIQILIQLMILLRIEFNHLLLNSLNITRLSKFRLEWEETTNRTE